MKRSYYAQSALSRDNLSEGVYDSLNCITVNHQLDLNASEIDGMNKLIF